MSELEDIGAQAEGMRESGVGENDVLLGRSRLSYNHPGNKRFRQLIGEKACIYNRSANRKEKYALVGQIMAVIYNEGGRFLRFEDDKGLWNEVPGKLIREKVGHALRDAYHTHLKERNICGLSQQSEKSKGHKISYSRFGYDLKDTFCDSYVNQCATKNPQTHMNTVAHLVQSSASHVSSLQHALDMQMQHLLHLRSKIQATSLRLQNQMPSQYSSSSISPPIFNPHWTRRGMVPIDHPSSECAGPVDIMGSNHPLARHHFEPEPIRLVQVSDDEIFESDDESVFDIGQQEDMNTTFVNDRTLETLRKAMEFCEQDDLDDEDPNSSLLCMVSNSLAELDEDPSDSDLFSIHQLGQIA